MSKSFKTKAGTEIPLLNLKGKDYLQVAHRIAWFCEENPTYIIDFQFNEMTADRAVCTASVTIINERGQVQRQVKATKSEDKKGFGDFIEKAQTGALGRALGMLGYGTQFTGDEFDEGARLADSPIEAVRPAAKVAATTLSAVTSSGGEVAETTPASFKTRSKRSPSLVESSTSDDI